MSLLIISISKIVKRKILILSLCHALSCHAKNTKHVLIVACLVLLSACNVTSSPATVVQANPLNDLQRMNQNCISLVKAQQQALETAQTSQYLSLAQTAESCIVDIHFPQSHPDLQSAMQFNALAVVNYIKAGDISAASDSLSMFKTKFPMQDLLFDDFTSFVDTATLLTKGEQISHQQLALLNVNGQLRAEIKRQRQWLLQ